MKVVFTRHARERMKERLISREDVVEALENPTKVGYDKDGKILVKKTYQKEGKERLLLIVGRISRETFKIITIIDSSKVKKYL